jgi:lysozyme
VNRRTISLNSSTISLRHRTGFLNTLTKKRIIIMSSIAGAAVVVVLLCFWLFAERTINGIDVSHYQGNISWTAMAQSSDVKFVYIKATEGSTNQDSSFKQNWEGALKNGITPGAYHYFTDTSPAQDQAENFIATVPKIKGMLPPAIDVEGSIAENSSFKSELTVFVNTVTEYYGVKPVFYTPYSVYNQIYDDYSNYDFWIIDDQTQPLVKGWTFRQYTTTGKIAGVDGDVDLDEYQGSLWDFEKLKLK